MNTIRKQNNPLMIENTLTAYNSTRSDIQRAAVHRLIMYAISICLVHWRYFREQKISSRSDNIAKCCECGRHH
jgi:hypothetical protein